MNLKIKNICCIGAGYVGGPTMAVIAEKCPNLQVVVVDINEERISQWNCDNLDELPVFEPGLAEIIKKCRGINLHFSNEIDEHIKKADMIFISVNTPTKMKGFGAGKASDLKWIESCARQVARFSSGHTIVVEKSTLPVRTAETIRLILEESKKYNKIRPNNSTFDVLSNPEFLAEGTAIEDLKEPDRVLIGGQNQKAVNALSQIYEKWVPKEKIIITNLWSSELAKLTANAFLAQRISSINSISALCEATGADIKEVSRAIGADSRIGDKFLNSGPGFGGSCFKKDILNLVYLSNHFGLPEVGKFWNEVVEINTWNKKRISRLITNKLFDTLSGKKICILGFAFKANTNDTRDSAAINICKELLEEGAFLLINDPKVSATQIEKDLGLPQIKKSKISISKNNEVFPEGSWQFSKEIVSSLQNSDAIVILTEWLEYKQINWVEVYKKMRKPAWIFDSRSLLDSKLITKIGFNYWRIGKSF